MPKIVTMGSRTLRLRCGVLPTEIRLCPLAFQRGGSVQVTDGNGEGIGGVGRFGDLGQIQQARDHVLHLLLLCPAIADYRRFDGERRVLRDFESR